MLSGNAAAEAGDWIHRPHMHVSGGHHVAGVTIARLPTEQRRTTIVSANYDDHGLWSLLDPDRGVLYHEGIGLDTAAYAWSETHSAWPRRKVRTVEAHLDGDARDGAGTLAVGRNAARCTLYHSS